jgi:hypothetical protein
MRTPPMMSVELDGEVVRRPGTLDVMLYDRTGKPIASRMRPKLMPGEVLRERAGMIPVIEKASSAAGARDIYRHQIVRAVTGAHPAMLAKEADPVALDSLCRRLVDAYDAMQLLRANGCGRYSDSLADMVRMLLASKECSPNRASRD